MGEIFPPIAFHFTT